MVYSPFIERVSVIVCVDRVPVLGGGPLGLLWEADHLWDIVLLWVVLQAIVLRHRLHLGEAVWAAADVV